MKLQLEMKYETYETTLKAKRERILIQRIQYNRNIFNWIFNSLNRKICVHCPTRQYAYCLLVGHIVANVFKLRFNLTISSLNPNDPVCLILYNEHNRRTSVVSI